MLYYLDGHSDTCSSVKVYLKCILELMFFFIRFKDCTFTYTDFSNTEADPSQRKSVTIADKVKNKLEKVTRNVSNLSKGECGNKRYYILLYYYMN